jgi:hypothetical protein
MQERDSANLVQRPGAIRQLAVKRHVGNVSNTHGKVDRTLLKSNQAPLCVADVGCLHRELGKSEKGGNDLWVPRHAQDWSRCPPIRGGPGVTGGKHDRYAQRQRCCVSSLHV